MRAGSANWQPGVPVILAACLTAFFASLFACVAFAVAHGEYQARKRAEARALDLDERLIATLAALQSERVWLSAARGPATEYMREQVEHDRQVWRDNFAGSD